MKRRQRVNVLVVFDQSEKSYQWSLSTLTLRLLLVGGILLGLIALASVLMSWWIIVQRGELSKLAAENRRLTVYALEINQLREELIYHRDFTRRLCELVGVEFPDSTRLSVNHRESMVIPNTAVGSTFASSRSVGKDLRLDNDALMPNQLAADAENKPIGIPMRGRFSRGFAPDQDNLSIRHFGLDIAAREGSPVLATAAGVVLSAGWDETMGNTIVIDHQNGYQTTYGHNSMMMCKTGDQIQFGDVICLSGNTGISSAPHLHYEIRYYDQSIDPLHFIFPDQTSVLTSDSSQAGE